MNKLLIGIAGPARAGKDTIATYMEKKYDLFRYALATPIKLAARHIVPGESVEGTLDINKDVVIPRLGVTRRKVYQLLGTEFRNMINPRLWLYHMEDRLEEVRSADNWRGMVVSDVRYDAEAELIKSLGGEIWKVSRPGLDLSETFRQHSSEKGISDDLVDCFVVNDTDIPSLHAVVDDLLSGLR